MQELQNSQESSSRKLLSRKTFNEAEKEVKELTEKEVALATEKRQAKTYEKFEPEFQVNTYTASFQRDSSVCKSKVVMLSITDGNQRNNRSDIFRMYFFIMFSFPNIILLL